MTSPTPRTTIAMALLAGAALALIGTWGFAELADEVLEGSTQAFDEAVLRHLNSLGSDSLTAAMIKVTALANTVVLATVTAIVALLLWTLGKRNPAVLLVAVVLGASLITFALKNAFDRPRPPESTWGVNVSTPSFPSGHASGALAAYGTITYIAARLQRRRWTRALTVAAGLLLILAISVSRLILGVHYPSDVLAGHLVAISWAGLCVLLLGRHLGSDESS